MIIRDDESAVGGGDTTTFTLVPADGSAELSVTMPDLFSDDFGEHLRTRGFHLPSGTARSTFAEIIVATAENPAAWAAIGGTVVAFLRRHRGKVHRFEIAGELVSIEGYSARDTERLVTQLTESVRKHNDGPRPGGMTLGQR